MGNNLALNLDDYRVATDGLLTPALTIYPALVRHNIERMISLLGEEPGRWRPHLKTVKLESMIRLLVEAGVTSAKCATTLELQVACRAGMRDVLVAYAHTGQNAKRIASIAASYPEVRISAVVDSLEHIQNWLGTTVDLFIDINTGMNRTGIEAGSLQEIIKVASAIQDGGQKFRGLHYYDGHATEEDLELRKQKANLRYDQLESIVSAMESAGIAVGEVITSGTPALPCALSNRHLWDTSFSHQVSPGTIVYNDSSSLRQLPAEFGFKPAVLVVSRVVSHPRPGIITCDAGHKAVSVDSGVPNCTVLGRPEFTGSKPSEEHLPFEVPVDSPEAAIGSTLYLLPRHVCPTVNNFDYAALVEGGQIVAVEPVSARGHEGPFSEGYKMPLATKTSSSS